MPRRIAVFCDRFPELTETFVVSEIAALRAEGCEVRVIAADRPSHEGPAPGVPVTYLSEVSRARKARDGAWLAARDPQGWARDRADRAAWRPEEDPRRTAALAPVVRDLAAWGAEHVHVHFAAGAAIDGLRAGALLGVPVSITAHAWEIFRSPRNLRRKLERAAFATSGCAYNVEHLRREAPGATVHEIVMGVDPEVFRRSCPHPERGPVLAVGRLVEKKGFADLVRAAALLDDPPRVTIVGEGPLEGELRALAAELRAPIDFAGALPPAAVRERLEDAAVLAMPCVVAADGDRDSMPVVVKEAMAMEVPVVATEEVGLPEIVDASCGRLVAPRDPAALAGALGEVLAMGVGARAALGRAGRERVLERCDVRTETRRLLALTESAERKFARPPALG